MRGVRTQVTHDADMKEVKKEPKKWFRGLLSAGASTAAEPQVPAPNSGDSIENVGPSASHPNGATPNAGPSSSNQNGRSTYDAQSDVNENLKPKYTNFYIRYPTDPEARVYKYPPVKGNRGVVWTSLIKKHPGGLYGNTRGGDIQIDKFPVWNGSGRGPQPQRPQDVLRARRSG